MGFPTIRDDGTFEVLLRFKGTSRAGTETLQAWVSDWVGTNSEWPAFGKIQQFSRCFRSTPTVQLSSSGELCIRLYGASPYNNFWKDWYVRDVRDAD
jgi:hypothetical protein